MSGCDDGRTHGGMALDDGKVLDDKAHSDDKAHDDKVRGDTGHDEARGDKGRDGGRLDGQVGDRGRAAPGRVHELPQKIQGRAWLVCRGAGRRVPATRGYDPRARPFFSQDFKIILIDFP